MRAMEYKNSYIVDPSRYDSKGLISDLPVRKSLYSEAEYVGSIRAQEDWNNLVAPLGEFHGNLDPNLGFFSVSFPECRPERLEILSYSNEFAFIYDDATENIPHEEAFSDMKETLELFILAAETGSMPPQTKGKNKIQKQIFDEMIAIDKPRALVTMKCWAEFLQLTSSRDRRNKFDTLDEYIPYRVWDVGQMLMYGFLTFGLALSIPESDIPLATSATSTAFAVISLTNDLFSWERERDAAKRDGMPHVVNAVWVIMGQHSVSEEEAKKICHAKIVELVEEYKQTVMRMRNDDSVHEDLKKYVELIQCNVSGNLAWSLSCPRYNPESRLNGCQAWMKAKIAQKAP